MLLAHLKLAHKLRKDPKEGLGVGGFAVFSKVRGGFAEFFHSSLLLWLQRLKCGMSVFQEVLRTPSRGTNILSSLLLDFLCISLHVSVVHASLSSSVSGKDTLMTTAKRSSVVAGIFWQAERMSWMVVWRSLRSDVMVLWFTEDR